MIPHQEVRLTRRFFSVQTSVFLLLWLGWAATGYPEAFRILDQSASATAQGTAFAAQADDPSALHFNPAAMTQLPGIQMSVGTLLVGGSIDFTPNAGPMVEGDFGSAIANPPPTSLYITANLGDLGFSAFKQFTIGMGVNSPFGNLTDYPRSSTLAQVLASSASPILDFKPTIAYRHNDILAVGFGIDIYTFSSLVGEGHTEFQQIAGADLVATGLASAGDSIELNGTDTALGFNLSLLWTPLRNANRQPIVNVALVYRSHVELELEGQFINQTTGATLDASAALDLPQILTTGVAVWPIRNTQREWKVEFDFDYADWTSKKNLDITLSNGLVLPKPRNWRPAYIFMLGSEYKLLNPVQLPNWDVAFRGGYVFSESPVPETTFKPDVPDSNYHAISFGLGFLCTNRGLFLGFIRCGNDGSTLIGTTAIGIDLAYQAILYQSRGITANDDPLGRVNGVWDTIIHVGALNLRTNFELTP